MKLKDKNGNEIKSNDRVVTAYGTGFVKMITLTGVSVLLDSGAHMWLSAEGVWVIT